MGYLSQTMEIIIIQMDLSISMDLNSFLIYNLKRPVVPIIQTTGRFIAISYFNLLFKKSLFLSFTFVCSICFFSYSFFRSAPPMCVEGLI